MKLKKIFIALVFVLCCNLIKAQLNSILADSLTLKLKTLNFDTNRIKCLNELAFTIKYSDPELAEKYCNEVLLLGEKLKFYRGLAFANKTKGILLDEEGNYPESINAYMRSLAFSQKINDKIGIARTEANIGIVLRKLKKNREAIDYFKRSHLFFVNKYPIYEMTIQMNIGICYMNLKNADSALFYTKNAHNIMLTNNLNDPKVYGNLGLAYSMKKDHKQAEVLIKKCLEMEKSMGKDPSSIAVWCENLAQMYIYANKRDEAIKLLQEAISLFGENKYIYEATFTYGLIVEAYEKNNDTKNALKYHKILSQIKDSIYNSENSKQINEVKEKYETEKKETEIKLLTADKATQEQTLKKNKAIIYSGTVLTILLIIFAIFIFRNNRQKRKINNELISKNSLIESQKKEVEAQKEIVEEKQKEILDSISYAKRLQQAILPPDNFIKNYLPHSFIYYQPKDIVAGDFYWTETVSDKILIAVADCTGHGVPGAMVSVVCSNALNRTVKEFKITEPGKILDKVRELVIETFEKSESEVKDGMDISLISIDKNTSSNKKITAQWAGANNPLWYFSDSEMKEIKANKQPIGKTDIVNPFTTHSLSLKSGDKIYLFTDGYADQFGGEKGKKFKYKQLQNLLAQNNTRTAEELKEILKSSFDNWRGTLEQVDDVCILGIEV
ncbi:MAG: tetratricopeptide repeat protein [Bacteroidetes bacterium]|nr:tetratricopeptide repeat protein [Bacteroidota bacterium]